MLNLFKEGCKNCGSIDFIIQGVPDHNQEVTIACKDCNCVMQAEQKLILKE